MKDVGGSFDFEVIDLEIAALQQQFAGIANQEADYVALLRKPSPLPAPIAILQLDFQLARAPPKLVDILNRKHHARYVRSNVNSAVTEHPVGRADRISYRGGHQFIPWRRFSRAADRR